MGEDYALAVVEEPYITPTVEEGEFEREMRIANDVFDGLPDSSPFVQHPQGRHALTLLVIMRPEIGRGRRMGWKDASEVLADEVGLSVTPEQLRGLCERRLDVGMMMDAEWFRAGIMRAAGNLNKAADVFEIAHLTKLEFIKSLSDPNATYRDKASMSKAAVSSADKANELGAPVGAGIKTDKAPLVNIQNNSFDLRDHFGGPLPAKRADVVDAERAD